MPTISPHAIVECPDNLADDVVVGPFSYVGRDVRIGPGTRVDNNVTLDGTVCIGSDCHIYPFAVIGQVAVNGAPSGPVGVGNRCKIREHAVIRCGRKGSEGTRIGSDTLVMTGCYVGPDVAVADHVVLGNYCQFADRSRIEKHVWAAAFTGTAQDITIGRYSFTSGYAGIDRDAPPFAILQGYPFRIRGVNVLNLRRCGFAETQIARLKEIFRALFDVPDGAEALSTLAERGDLDENQRYLVEYLQAHRASLARDDSAAPPQGGL